MKSPLIFTTALALVAAPSFAGLETPSATDTAVTPVTSTAADPASTATPSGPVASDAVSATEAAPAPVSADQLVENEFASYDTDQSGQLDSDEFAAWVVKLRNPADPAAASGDTESWSSGLFARADTDKDQLVSKGEMKTLLSQAAQG